MGEPQHMGRVLSNLLKKGGMEREIKQKQAVLIWDKVVGPKVAAQAKAIKAEGSSIFVKVRNPVWRTELLFMKKRILEELNNELGKEVIKELVLFGE